jgi:hypothetical protein
MVAPVISAAWVEPRYFDCLHFELLLPRSAIAQFVQKFAWAFAAVQLASMRTAMAASDFNRGIDHFLARSPTQRR